MSLHLIESEGAHPTTTRKRVGVAASVLLHAALVTGVFTVATATPVRNVIEHLEQPVYVDHAPPPPAPRIAAARSAPCSTPCTAATMPALIPELVVPSIAVTIPSIDNVSATDALANISSGVSHAADAARRGGSGSGRDGDGGVLTGLQVDRPVVALAGFKLPRYPESLRAAGIEDTVVATFVVDTLGRIEPGSLAIPATARIAFASAVRDALATARFRPAEAGGAKVRQLVSQAFVFSLQREQ